MGFTFADLFAGIGGFHAALSAFGGRAVVACEIDARAAAVYERNWGITAAGDVIALAAGAQRIPSHTVLAGGFPCQPFSKSGCQRGMTETRGQAFTHLLDIVKVKQPPVLFLENVRNIAGPRQRGVWRAVIDGLRGAGYRVPDKPAVFSPHLLPPERGGAPQVRDRVYIMGTFVGSKRARRETDVEPCVARRPVDRWDPHGWDLLGSVVSDVDTGLGPYKLDDEHCDWVDTWNDLLARLGEVHLPGFPLWSAYWHDAARVDNGAPRWKQSLESKNLDFYRTHRRVIRAWLRANPQLREFPSSRQKLEWQAADGPRDLRACLLHFRPSGIRAKRPTYAPALVAMAQTPVIGPLGRRLTPTEAARLQGFPDWFTFNDQGDAHTYKQLGNAVNVGAAYHVFREHVTRNAEDIVALPGGDDLVKAVTAASAAPEVPHRESGAAA